MAQRYGFLVAKAWSEGRDVSPLNDLQADLVPELAWFHAIPNGGERDKVTAGKLKAEGVKAGVWDTFLPVPSPYDVRHYTDNGAPHYSETYAYMGLYIEFKTPDRLQEKNAGLSDAQIKFGSEVGEQGYCMRVAYSWREAANNVMEYYGSPIRFETETST